MWEDFFSDAKLYSQKMQVPLISKKKVNQTLFMRNLYSIICGNLLLEQ